MHRLQPILPLALLGGIAVGALLAAAPAAAMQDHTVELQLDASAVADLVRREILGTERCPETVECPGGGDCVLDHIEVPSVGSFGRGASAGAVSLGDGTTIAGIQPVRLEQPIQVFLKTLACVEDGSCGQHDYLLDPVLNLVLEFGVETGADGGLQICAELVGTNPDLGLAGLLPDFEACGDLPTDSFDQLLGDQPLVRQGISLSGDAGTLAVRLDFDPGPADTSAWAGFLGGALASEPTNSELAVIFDRSILQNAFKDFIDLDDISEVNPDGPKTSSWLPMASSGLLIWVTTPGEAIVPVCPDIDLDINTSFLIDFDSSTDELVVDASFSIDLNEWDMLACTALTAGWGGPAVMAIAAPVLTAIGHGLAPDAQEASEKSSGIPDECLVSGDDSFTCRFPVDLDPLRLSAASGAAAGLEVQGQMALQGSYSLVGDVNLFGNTQPPQMSFAKSDLAFHVGHDCHSVHAGYTGWIDFWGNAGICEIDYRDDIDTLDAYVVTETIQNDQLPAILEVEMADLGYDYAASFWNNPYGFAVTMYMTAGALTVQMDAPDEASAAEQDAAILAVAASMAADCTEWSEGWLGDPGGYNPLWDIDPPPFQVIEQEQLFKPVERGFVRDVIEKLVTHDGLYSQEQIVEEAVQTRKVLRSFEAEAVGVVEAAEPAFEEAGTEFSEAADTGAEAAAAADSEVDLSEPAQSGATAGVVESSPVAVEVAPIDTGLTTAVGPAALASPKKLLMLR